MKIAIVTHGESPFGHTYGRIFRQRGHEVELFSISAYESPGTGAPVRVVGPRDFKPWLKSSRLMPYLRTILPLRREVKRFDPDVVFAMHIASGGLLGCLSGGRNIVISAHGSEIVTRAGSRLWGAIYRWESRKACVIHVVSEVLADIMRTRFRMDAGKMLVAPIGVDTTALAMVDPASRPGANRVLCTRSHKPVYDQATLVRAMARLRDRGASFHVTFAHPHLAQTTRQLVEEHGLAAFATFLPGYTVDQLPQLMRGADVYVSTSVSDGTSISLLEAMSTGTFPVVSDIPANRPWIEDGRSGLLFPVGDDAALADALQRAFADADLRASAAVGRELVVAKADIYHEADRLLEAFARCAQNKAHR